MIKMRPYVPAGAVRADSIDEDFSDDVEDEVFIKDARSAKKMSEEKGLKRPLMAPRRKHGKTLSAVPIMKKHRRCCWRCCEPFCYGLAALTVLIALVSLGALILTIFPLPLQQIKVWLKRDHGPAAMVPHFGADTPATQAGSSSSSSSPGGIKEVVPCTQISVQKVWTRNFPRMNSESPVRKADLNGDGVKDIIFGYGVDDNIQYEGYSLPRCRSPQMGDEVPCEGGVIALNGVNGELLWQSWSVANVFSLLCSMDIDKDGYTDCVAAGRLGMIYAVNGRNGRTIWDYREIEVETNSPIVMDLYTINVVRDLDGDEVVDILAAHLEEREESKSGHIKVLSGKTGKVIRSIPTPLRQEVFVPLQVVIGMDGTEVLLITTGGQTTPGGVYSIRLLTLMQYTTDKAYTPLFQTLHSGLMSPAILTDLNGDNVSDIVVSSFNETVYAFDGRNFSQLWNYTFPRSESVSAIVPGHFNHDNVTDFMVKYNYGPGFPVYYYSQTTIIDGRNGQPLLDSMMMDAGGSNSLLGGVSVSQTFGGDFFLHWQLQCRDKYEPKDAYEFIPDSDIIQQARADTCRLRYNASAVVKLYAIARHIEPPGAVIFSTDDLEVHLNRTQYSHSAAPTSEPHLNKSPLKHPKLLKKLLANREQLLKKLAAGESIAEHPKHSLVKLPTLGHHRTNVNLMRNPVLEQEVLQEIQNELPLELDGGAFEPLQQQQLQLQQQQQQQRPMQLQPPESIKPNTFGYFARGGGATGPAIGGGGVYRTNGGSDYELESARAGAAAATPVEYDTLYNDELPELVPPNDHPIRLRTKYPPAGNRDVRSDATTFQRKEQTNGNHTLLLVGEVKPNILEKPLEPFSLWDLEMEKEERDAMKEAAEARNKLDYGNLNTEESRRRRRRQQNVVGDKPKEPQQQQQQQVANSTATPQSNASVMTTTPTHSSRDEPIAGGVEADEWYLATISSTGVLLKSLNNTKSSLDFAFVLNIRESETFPPLFLPQDLTCVDEKISAFKNYAMDNLRELRKQFLKKCLNDRLVNVNTDTPKYESQLVVTRIGIQCTCRSVQPGEVCSELEDIEAQRWTEFMGNDGNGFYAN